MDDMEYMTARMMGNNSLYREIDQRRAWNRSMHASLVKGGGWSHTARGQVRSQIVRNTKTIDEHKILLGNKFY